MVEKAQVERSLLAKSLYVILWFFAAVLISIIIEWVIITKWYPDQGSNRSLGFIKKELSYLEKSDLMKTEYGNNAVGVLFGTQETVYHEISDTLRFSEVGSALRTSRLNSWFAKAGLLPPTVYLVTATNMVNVVTLRVVVIILSLPIFILMLVWGLSVGLTRRSIRKYQVRNESSWTYHLAKSIKSFAVIMPILIYVAWPDSIHPVLVFGPFAIAYGMAWLMFASKFKRLW